MNYNPDENAFDDPFTLQKKIHFKKKTIVDIERQYQQTENALRQLKNTNGMDENKRTTI